MLYVPLTLVADWREKKKSLNTSGHLGSFPVAGKLLAHTEPERVQREI